MNSTPSPEIVEERKTPAVKTQTAKHKVTFQDDPNASAKDILKRQ